MLLLQIGIVIFTLLGIILLFSLFYKRESKDKKIEFSEEKLIEYKEQLESSAENVSQLIKVKLSNLLLDPRLILNYYNNNLLFMIQEIWKPNSIKLEKRLKLYCFQKKRIQKRLCFGQFNLLPINKY